MCLCKNADRLVRVDGRADCGDGEEDEIGKDKDNDDKNNSKKKRRGKLRRRRIERKRKRTTN